MSVLVTLAAPDVGQEPEQRRNITQETIKNKSHSADSVIIQPEPHKRKRNYVPKTPQECERSKILKRGSTPLRERFMSNMQYNSLSKATQKNYLNAVFDFIAHYYKSPEKIADEEIREYFNYEINVRHLSTYSLMVHRAALLFLYEKTLNLSRLFLHIFHPKKGKRHREILTQQEVKHFLFLVENTIFRVLSELLYASDFDTPKHPTSQFMTSTGQMDISKSRAKAEPVGRSPIQAKMLAHLERCWQFHRHPELLFPLCEIHEFLFHSRAIEPVSPQDSVKRSILWNRPKTSRRRLSANEASSTSNMSETVSTPSSISPPTRREAFFGTRHPFLRRKKRHVSFPIP